MTHRSPITPATSASVAARHRRHCAGAQLPALGGRHAELRAEGAFARGGRLGDRRRHGGVPLAHGGHDLERAGVAAVKECEGFEQQTNRSCLRELAEIAQWRRRLRVEDAAEFAHYGGPPRAPNLSIFFGDDRSNYSTASSEHSAAAATPRAVAAAGTGGSSGALPGELRMMPQPTGPSAADAARAGLSGASAPPPKRRRRKPRTSRSRTREQGENTGARARAARR